MYLEEYVSITTVTNFNLKVLPCEIKERIYNSTHDQNDPYPYELVTFLPLDEADRLRIDVKDFRWEPACEYIHSYGLDITPDVRSVF